jgi:hypothetical protein
MIHRVPLALIIALESRTPNATVLKVTMMILFQSAKSVTLGVTLALNPLLAGLVLSIVLDKILPHVNANKASMK